MGEGPALHSLTTAEAAARLAHDGYNELPSAKPRRPWTIAWDVVREPMFLLLICAAAIYLALGDLREALALLASVLVMIGITFYQQRKTERALDALRELSSPRAKVLRDGEWRTVAGRDVVVGDRVRVTEGDRVPADSTLEWAADLMTDESLLTGESVPVTKRSGEPGVGWLRPGGDDLPHIYSGTLVTRGQGIARVVATGRGTEMGKIGKALQSIVPEPSPLQRETRHAVLAFAAIGITLCVLVALLYVVARGDWLTGVLAGVTLAMANLPEEFPVVLTVFMALGAWRISKQGVLTRRAPAIETLGATQVLCVDKTGTLTQNRMEVRRFWAQGEIVGVEGEGEDVRSELIECCVLASEREPFDPMEQAFKRFAQARVPERAAGIAKWTLVHGYPLTPRQLSVAHVWHPTGADACVIAAKGAPEAIAGLCGLDAAERARVHAAVEAMTRDGLRVLAAATGRSPLDDRGACRWPASQRDLRLRFAGLVGLADPVRPTVPGAIAECYRAGIRTVMITGDHLGTARAIARQIGLADPARVVTGPQLESMTDEELRETVTHSNVFARVMPEHKLRLVEAFKANGQVVAMTGDGVNDAPALRAAHIGVAMGSRGSDVAREAAALVLLDDDFSSLVAAVRLGRRIYDNIRKAMCYIVAVHVPPAGMSLLPLLMGWPLLFYPVHIVFLELVIDPACSIAFEAEPADRDVMRRPPRAASARLFDPRMLAASVGQGAAILVGAALLYGNAIVAGAPEDTARAMGFSAIVLANVALIVGNSSRHPGLRDLLRPNPAMWSIVGGAVVALVTVLYVPALQEIFRFGTLSGAALLLSALPALVVLSAMTLAKSLGVGARR
jgi:Ca2+-transporting ATPase